MEGPKIVFTALRLGVCVSNPKSGTRFPLGHEIGAHHAAWPPLRPKHGPQVGITDTESDYRRRLLGRVERAVELLVERENWYDLLDARETCRAFGSTLPSWQTTQG